MRMRKKLLALVLAVVMTAALIPAQCVSAAGTVELYLSSNDMKISQTTGGMSVIVKVMIRNVNPLITEGFDGIQSLDFVIKYDTDIFDVYLAEVGKVYYAARTSSTSVAQMQKYLTTTIREDGALQISYFDESFNYMLKRDGMLCYIEFELNDPSWYETNNKSHIRFLEGNISGVAYSNKTHQIKSFAGVGFPLEFGALASTSVLPEAGTVTPPEEKEELPPIVDQPEPSVPDLDDDGGDEDEEKDIVLPTFVPSKYTGGYYSSFSSTPKPSPTATPEVLLELIIGSRELAKNGTKSQMDVAPYIDTQDRTMVPVRFISEAMGMTVGWDEALSQVTITQGETTIIMTIDKNVAIVNGQEITLDTVPVITDDRTFVPVRFISEIMKFTVDWDEKQSKVSIMKFKQ